MDQDDIERLLASIDEAQNGVAEERLTPAQQIFRRVWELEAEVNNGGFSLLFSNSTGRHAEAAIEALKVIGAYKCAELVQKAVEMHALGNAEGLDDLDGDFFAYPDDLASLIHAFVERNPEDFATGSRR